jgi:hypothetical protein
MHGMIRVLPLLVGFALLLTTFAGSALADRGGIPPINTVTISEPAQRAIVAFNGKKEIIILQTDVRADRETPIVEFMPLPSLPWVTLAPEDCFEQLSRILEAHELRYVGWRDRSSLSIGTIDSGDPVTVVVEAQLGLHEITVIEVATTEGFLRWVRSFFRQRGLGEPLLSKDLRAIVDGYLARGFRYFAFDIITLQPETQTVQPVAYTFATRRLYYPLQVTNLYGGRGAIQLLTILPRSMRELLPVQLEPDLEKGGTLPLDGYWRCDYSGTTRLRRLEMSRLHPALPRLMKGRRAMLQAVRYNGPLYFSEDVWLSPSLPTLAPRTIPRRCHRCP